MNNQWGSVFLCSVLVFFSCTSLFAQLENTRWYFGRPAVGLYFDPNSNFAPTLLNNSNYPGFAFETAGVVTDPITGELLFYTNGDVVLNKYHQQMPNGYGLGACYSSAQAVGLAPVPGSCTKYYVFCNSHRNCTGYGQTDIHWSIVDMALDNGLGDVEVATKNTILRTETRENLLIIQRPGFEEYWIISDTSEYFVVHLLDAAGIHYAGRYPSYTATNEVIFNTGYSSQAGKIASTYSGGLRISDFDANTGAISNTYLHYPIQTLLYDAEFSPDGTKLYYTKPYGSMYQYDFTTMTETLIYSSPFTTGGGGGLATGPDGKIYLIPDYYANEYVCVVSNPNGAGANCNFIDNYIHMGQVINGFNFPVTLPSHIEKVSTSLSISTDPCADQTHGNAIIMGYDGQAPYSYEWSNGSTSDTLRRVGYGTYYVTTTDAIGCKTKDTVFIGLNNVQFYLNPQIYGIPCDGNGTAGVDLQPTGGTPPYTIVWADGNTNVTRFGLTAGQYAVTASDAGGCSFSTTINIIQPTPIVVSETHIDAGCGGQNTGSINISVSGGQPGYTYAWNDNIYTQNRTGLAPGTYTVKVYDSAFCFTTLSITIAQGNGLNVNITSTNVSCFGGSDATATATAIGGTAPYTYQWSNGTTTDTVNGLFAGVFSVTVLDANGCSGSDTANITQNQQLILTETHMDASCGNANGTITITANGGQAGYTFTWNDGNNDQNRTALAAGNYTVTVTDAAICTAAISVTIGQNAGPIISLFASDVSCYDGNNGSATVVATGGTAPYSYQWGNGETTDSINNLVAGTYAVTVSDANGCNGSDSVTITQNTQLMMAETHTDATCGNANGTINLTVSGGQPNYTFTWNDGNTTQNRTDLPAGSYTVTVTDASNCTATVSVSIGQNDGPVIYLSASDASCYGDNDGSASVVAIGGTAPYTYQWNNGETTDTINGLTAGNYTVTATDSTGCFSTDSIIILQPDAISVTIFPVDTIAAGEPVTIQIITQTNPGTTSYLWEPATGLSCTDCPEPTANVAQSTFYALTIDNNGCIASDSVWITVVADTAINDTIALYIPTAFSPNNDGKNDVYYIYGKGIKNISWSVFDRWGELVFTANDINSGWNGTMHDQLLPPGLFVVDVSVELINLSTVHKTQSIMLMR